MVRSAATSGAGSTTSGVVSGSLGSREINYILRVLGPAACRNPDIFTEVANCCIRIALPAPRGSGTGEFLPFSWPLRHWSLWPSIIPEITWKASLSKCWDMWASSEVLQYFLCLSVYLTCPVVIPARDTKDSFGLVLALKEFVLVWQQSVNGLQIKW